MDTRAKGPEPDIIGIDKPNNSSAYSAILWITFVVALGATVFLFMLSRSTQNALAVKQQAKNEIESQLASPAYTEVEKKANAFKEAFDILTTLSTQKMSKKDLLTELFQNFTNDVTVKNLTLNEDGGLTIDAATYSYRSAADFMTALKNYKRVSEVRLIAASVDTTDGVAASQKISFSISAKVDTEKEQPAAAAANETENTAAVNSGDSETTSDAADETPASDSYDSASSTSTSTTGSSSDSNSSELVSPDDAGTSSPGI